MASRTIRNLVWKKELIKNVHNVKPTPRKLIFIWEKVEEWLHGGPANIINAGNQAKSLIKI